jgi:hypothetical protein
VSPMFASLKVDASIHCAWLYPIDACGERVTQCSELPIRSHAAHVIGIASGPLKGPAPGLAQTYPGPGPDLPRAWPRPVPKRGLSRST